jgi:hypothetical protein
MGQLMRKTRRVAFVGALAACLASPAAFAFDPTKADIVGIRLYQSKDQVIAALKKRYGPAVKLDITMASRLLGQGERVGEISVEDRGYLLGIVFAEPVPPRNTKNEIVWAVSYTPTSHAAKNERYRFRDSVMAKYGTPTVSPDAEHAQWCEFPKSGNNGSKAPRNPSWLSRLNLGGRSAF